MTDLLIAAAMLRDARQHQYRSPERQWARFRSARQVALDARTRSRRARRRA